MLMLKIVNDYQCFVEMQYFTPQINNWFQNADMKLKRWDIQGNLNYISYVTINRF